MIKSNTNSDQLEVVVDTYEVVVEDGVQVPYIEEAILEPLDDTLIADDTNDQSEGESVLDELKTSVEPIVEPTVANDIYTKYNDLINKAKNGYVSGYDYKDIMEILRYCESKLKKELPMNTSCAPCVVDLILLFDRLR